MAAEDWECCTPAVVAALSAHDALARTLAARQLAWCAEQGGAATAEERKTAERELIEEVEALAGAASERALRARLAQLSVRERARAALNIDERPLLHDAHVLRGEVSAADCDWLLGTLRDAIAVEGWASARHKFHPTVDYPVARCPAAAAWMRRRLAERIFPAMAAAFGLAAADLRLHECFVVRYEPGGQPALELHKDGTLLSCNFLLNRRAEFGGGATCFAAPVAVHEHRGSGAPAAPPPSERQELDDVDIGDVATASCFGVADDARRAVAGLLRRRRSGDSASCRVVDAVDPQAATETQELEALAAEFEAEQRHARRRRQRRPPCRRGCVLGGRGCRIAGAVRKKYSLVLASASAEPDQRRVATAEPCLSSSGEVMVSLSCTTSALFLMASSASLPPLHRRPRRRKAARSLRSRRTVLRFCEAADAAPGACCSRSSSSGTRRCSWRRRARTRGSSRTGAAGARRRRDRRP